jgi:ribosomal-protein-alanine N-acetyltransferase
MIERAPWEVPSPATRIATERLVLRPPAAADVLELRRVLRANAAHLRPWTVAPAAGEDAITHAFVSRTVARYSREWKRGQSFVLLLCPRDDERRIVGRVTLGGILRGAFQNAHLGYWIDEKHQGRGLMTEAVRAATTFALGPACLHRVQAAAMPRNGASQRVLEKAGYRREGLAARYLHIASVWEDHVIFSVTAEEWYDGTSAAGGVVNSASTSAAGGVVNSASTSAAGGVVESDARLAGKAP